MLHTIDKAITLTGKSRRTIYNHCKQGLVSYSVGSDGRRYVDTSELIRVYGPLHTPAQAAQPNPAQKCTPLQSDVPGSLTEETAVRLAAAMERLIELEEKKLLLLEHKPDSPEKTDIPTNSSETTTSELGEAVHVLWSWLLFIFLRVLALVGNSLKKLLGRFL